MAERAERMIDEANRLEHSWSRSPDMSAKPPGPRTIHKARRLRKDGIAILNRLKDTAPPISD
ncbi:MAG: hypothetical protein GY725_00510 [bacterium]|nr:hypothetical protein [bacterium]